MILELFQALSSISQNLFRELMSVSSLIIHLVPQSSDLCLQFR